MKIFMLDLILLAMIIGMAVTGVQAREGFEKLLCGTIISDGWSKMPDVADAWLDTSKEFAIRRENNSPASQSLSVLLPA